MTYMTLFLIILTASFADNTFRINSSKKIEKERHIEAPAKTVWEILTHPDKMKDWLYGTRVKSEWEPGSAITFSFTWNNRQYRDKGTVLQYKPEKIFSYNYWSELSGIPDQPENYSVITFELSTDGGGTLLKLTHANFANETMYQHSERNWEEALDTIKSICENN